MPVDDIFYKGKADARSRFAAVVALIRLKEAVKDEGNILRRDKQD